MNGFLLYHPLQEMEERAIKFFPHDHHRKIADHTRLNEGGRLKQFVHGAKPSGKDHESIGVFEEHVFPYKEVPESDPAVGVWIW